MTFRVECDHGDYLDTENLISRLEVTTEKGIAATQLKQAEMSECKDRWNIHVSTHLGHLAKTLFLIPEGYVERDGIIYKAK